MLRHLLFVTVALAATAAQALAIPGQTPAQLSDWGKSNPALHGFKATMDQETGGTVYMATVTVDGMRADFSSEPTTGIARKEYVAFRGVDDAWQLAKHPALMLDTVRVVYGESYANDFRNATLVPLHGRVIAWRGVKLSYAAAGAALFTMTNAEFKTVLQHIRQCDAIDCED